MSWSTRLGGSPPAGGGGLSPTLLFHKWHVYDAPPPKLGHTETRTLFLEQVVQTVAAASADGRYAAWFEGWQAALAGLGAESDLEILRATTVWRLVAGFATNPALETGISLHHLLGFPFVPGSGVRGLAHHVAEMELLEDHEEWTEPAAPVPACDEITAFVVAAELRKTVFGSLSVEPLRRQLDGGGEELLGPISPRALLDRWKRQGELPRELKARIAALLDEHTGGIVAFYDAVPAPGQKQPLLQVDILNPHYPVYYRAAGAHPPSDDQDPIPVYFLAVRPATTFDFPFRVRAVQGDLSRESVQALVRGWLRKGLTQWGSGAKTAAGYGYFHFPEDAAESREGKEASPVSAVVSPPGWEKRAASLDAGTAPHHAPRLLAELAPEDRRRAALILRENLGKRFLRDPIRQDEAWVQEVLAAK